MNNSLLKILSEDIEDITRFSDYASNEYEDDPVIDHFEDIVELYRQKLRSLPSHSDRARLIEKLEKFFRDPFT